MRTRHPRSTRKPVFFARNVVYSQDLRDRANKLQVLLNEQVAVRACENAGHFANRDGGGGYINGAWRCRDSGGGDPLFILRQSSVIPVTHCSRPGLR